MEHKKVVDVPAVPASTKEVVERVTCDLCRQEIAPERRFEVREVTVQCRVGHSYPDGGGNLDIVEFDICVNCFNNVIVPNITRDGTGPRRLEIDT